MKIRSSKKSAQVKTLSLLSWIKNFTLKVVSEKSSYLLNFFFQSNRKIHKVILFGQGRSGSSLLESLLVSTKEFQGYGELLGPSAREVSHPFNYLSGLSILSKKNFLFHLKIYHLSRRKNKIDPALFLEQLNNDGWKMIYLKRNNIVRQQLSNCVAETRGHYHKFNKKKEVFSLVINCNEFVRKINERLEFLDSEKQLVKNFPHIKVVYEEDLLKESFHQKTIDNILLFLGLPTSSVKTTFKKINNQTIRSLVKNYSEFKACLKKNGWERFLD